MKVTKQAKVKFRWIDVDGKQVRIRVLTDAERQELRAKSIVETSHFYGWRTVKGLLKYAKANFSKLFGKILVADRSRAAIIGKRHSELKKAMEPRVAELMLVEPEILDWIARHIGKIRIAQRYGNQAHIARLIPKAALGKDEEREIQLPKGKRLEKLVKKWVKESATHVKYVRPPKRKTKKAKVTTMTYLESLRSRISGIEEWDSQTEKAIKRIDKDIQKVMPDSAPKCKRIDIIKKMK